jgi:hypothetical protein
MSFNYVSPSFSRSTVIRADGIDQLKPISSAYARYAPEATFHDPIGLANGLEAVVRSPSSCIASC